MNAHKAFLLLALLSAPFAPAQVTLHDFTAFESPDTTFFFGNWEATGDTGGSSSPRTGFTQGIGVYNFAGGSNDSSASAQYFYLAPINISGFSLLQVSAELLAGNTAPNFEITLFDDIGHGVTASFATSSLSLVSVTTLTANLDFAVANFDPTHLAGFQIGGGVFGGTDTLSFALDRLAVAAPVSAVPEPATYGVFAALALVGLVGCRRLRSRV
jgi:hypothetical protein